MYVYYIASYICSYDAYIMPCKYVTTYVRTYVHILTITYLVANKTLIMCLDFEGYFMLKQKIPIIIIDSRIQPAAPQTILITNLMLSAPAPASDVDVVFSDGSKDFISKITINYSYICKNYWR